MVIMFPLGKRVKYVLFIVYPFGGKYILTHEMKNEEMKEGRKKRNQRTWIITGETCSLFTETRTLKII